MKKVPEKRRVKILLELKNKKYIKGSDLAKFFKVTRQVIVKDIAILRAEGNDIIATPNGYFLHEDSLEEKIIQIIVTRHQADSMERELEIIIDNGGKVLDVIVEHPVYGEIRANLMLDNRADLSNFLEKSRNKKAKPLSSLTDGVHIHTIQADSREIIDRIIKQLNKEGFLIK